MTDRKSLAHRKQPKQQIRPREEWIEIQHPMLNDYLGELRDRAVVWQKEQLKKQEPSFTRKPASKDRHIDSSYFLKGILKSTDGHPLTGRTVGTPKARYYAIHRGFTTPKRDKTMRRLIPADQLETTVLNILRDMLLSTPDLKSRLINQIPEDVEDLFKQRFRNPNPVRIAEYDPAELKKLTMSAADRQRLYIYLALNCGYYQIDIGSLRCDEVVEKNGETMIIRKRSKTDQQNDFEAIHVLWSETAALLKREMAKSARFANDHDGLALLSNRGTPLYRKSPQCDLIGDSYLTLQHDAGVNLSFKQLRKIGATAMQRFGGDETRRLYKAGTIEDGDKVYVRETWAKLTPHLMAWGDELRLDGVLFDRGPNALKRKRRIQKEQSTIKKVKPLKFF
jgi:integrase